MNKKSGLIIGMALLLLTTIFIVVGGMVTEPDNLNYNEPDSELLATHEKDEAIEKQFMDASELDARLSQTPEAILLDVRNPPELEDGYIECSINIPLPVLDEDKLKNAVEGVEKDDPIFIYCRSGGRSEAAMEKLNSAGYSNVTSVDGGYSNYNGNLRSK